MEPPIQSKRYPEDEVDEMIEEYKAKFGGEEKWKYAGNHKFIAVKGAAVEFNTAQGELFISGNMNTGITMMRILQIKQECKKERELVKQSQVIPKKTCIHGCCSYPSD